MSVTDEMLRAYADGKLNAEDTSRIETALAEDPSLADKLAEARAQGTTAGAATPGSPTAQAATAPARYQVGPISLSTGQLGIVWVLALAGALAIGHMVGTRFQSKGMLLARSDGTYIATGSLANALDTQLASAQDDAPVRLLVSFRRASGDYCRGFTSAGVSGIACHRGGQWQLASRFRGARPANGDAGAYRQAGSTDAELMAEAQGMAIAGTLDPAGEAAARARGWR